MPCYLTHTGALLPGKKVGSDQIERYLGALDGEQDVRHKVLRMNGITGRHYAQDERQRPTHDVYQLAALAAADALRCNPRAPVTYLAAGTTYAPYSAPGLASVLHDRLSELGAVEHDVEISSHAGVCSSAAAALVGAVRGVDSGQHPTALAVGAEHASQVLKSSNITPIDDRDQHSDVRRSQWFMSVFLRFMLSDGGGAFLLESKPKKQGVSLRVDWTHSRSYAHLAPLCMKLDNTNALLSQDLRVLSKWLFPLAERFLEDAMRSHAERLNNYAIILPHLSSFFFRSKFEKVVRNHAADCDNPTPYWTNLATAGNTGAASIYVMLDEYLRTHDLSDGDRLLLFVPESGQFNYVMVSLTAVVR